jgi:hypothetical protein
MVECPVCGLVPSQGQVTCEVCGLPIEFFEAFREVAGPEVALEVASQGEAVAPVAVPGRPEPEHLDRPVPPSPHVGEATPAKPTPSQSRPSASKKGPGSEQDSQPKDEALRMARSLGIDVSELEGDLKQALSEGDAAQVSRVRRGLVRAVLDGLIDRYRHLCDRRNVLSSVMRTQALDTELVAYRRALSRGELDRAEEQRRKAARTVDSLEASLTRIRTRLAEASQMMRALREMGGVAPMALRPVADAVKVPREAEAGQIERRLDQTNGILWGLLAPRMNHEISKCLSALDQTEAPPSRTAPIRVEIDRMAEQIRAQKIAEALESHRFLRAELASLAPRAPRKTRQRFTIDQTHQS